MVWILRKFIQIVFIIIIIIIQYRCPLVALSWSSGSQNLGKGHWNNTDSTEKLLNSE